MFNWIKNRSREGSTYAGLSLISMAVGQLFGVREAEVAAQAIGAAGQAAVGGLDWMSIVATGLGTAAVVLKDKPES